MSAFFVDMEIENVRAKVMNYSIEVLKKIFPKKTRRDIYLLTLELRSHNNFSTGIQSEKQRGWKS